MGIDVGDSVGFKVGTKVGGKDGTSVGFELGMFEGPRDENKRIFEYIGLTTCKYQK